MKNNMYVKLMCKTLFTICLLMIAGLSQAQNIEVSGVVLDEAGEPLPGVSIQIKGTQRGATSGIDGGFTFKAGPRATLVFSFIGYEKREVELKGRSRLRVQMNPTVNQLDQVEIVVGYGSQRKEDLTGAISTLSGKELSEVPTVNLLDAIGSKIPGMQVLGTSEPGETASVRIRGVGSYNDSEPICVVDGQFMTLEELNAINTSDILSITVLKDASATAIYGSRGANGVILATTRQGSGEQGITRVNASVNFSLSEMERLLPLANTSQYQQIRNLEYLANNYQNADAANSIPYPEWQTAGKGTDWQDLANRTALTGNYQVSVSGSTKKANFYAGLGYLHQEGVIEYTDYKRLNAKINASYQLYKNLKIGVNMLFTTDNKGGVENNVFSLTGKRLPDAPVYNLSSDSDSENDFNGGDNNPYALLHYTHDRYRKINRFNSNYFLEWNIIKPLQFRTSFSTTYANTEEKIFLPAFMENVEDSNSPYKISRLTHNSANNNSWQLENTLTYNLHKKDHRLTVMGGFTMQYYRTQYANLFATGLPWEAWKNRNLWYVGQGTSVTGADGGSEKSYVSYLGRITYTLKGRYNVIATGRVDGSSSYPKNNRYGFFPSLGLGWTMSEENFLKGARWMDKLKLRASYGVVGNDKGVSNAQTLYANSVNIVTGPNNDIYSTDALKLMYDTTLSWEEMKSFNLGVDFAAFRNLFSVSVDWFYKETSKVMMPLLIQPSKFNVTSNIGTVTNKGLEWNVAYSPKLGNVNSMFTLTGSTVKNNVKKINDNIGGISNAPNRTLEGYPIGSFWGYNAIGVFQNDEQLASLPHINGTRVGELIFEDVNGDKVIDTNDYVYLGSYIPKVQLGFNAKFSYKGFTLMADLTSGLGHKVYNRRTQYRQDAQNFTTAMLDAWHGEGTSYHTPRVFVRGDASSLDSSYFIEDGNYLSIANVQLSYAFPRKLLKKIRMNNARIFLSGANLHTFTKATGYKTQISSTGNANRGGIDDFGLYPDNRTFTIGTSFSF